MNKKLASEGLHKIQLTNVTTKKIVEGIENITFAFQILDEDCPILLRTFKLPKDLNRVLQFISAMSGKAENSLPKDYSAIKSRVFNGHLKISQNKKYTNLIGTPKPLGNLSINTSFPVTDSKIGA